MRQTTNRTTLGVLSAALLLGVCGSAQAQNALGNGRALDANLNRNQGRINQRAPSIEDQIRFQNSVINGTAGSGNSFRGYVGYRAPDQFGTVGTRVGSDDLYSFRRDSVMSGVGGTGVRGSDALRYQFAASTGQTPPEFMGTPTFSVAKSGSVATGGNSTILRSTSDFLTQQSSRPSLVGAREDERGTAFVARASPLLGVTWVKSADSPLAVTRPPLEPTTENPLAPTRLPVAPGSEPSSGLLPPNTPTPQPGSVQNPLEKPDDRIGRPGFTPENTTPGVPAGERRPDSEARAPGGVQPVDTEQHTQIMNRFRQGAETAPAPTGKPEEGTAKPKPMTFDEQMDRLHRMLRGEAESPDRKSTRNPDGTIAPPAGDKAKDKTKKPAGTQQDERPTDGSKPAPRPGERRNPADLIEPKPEQHKSQEAVGPDIVRGLRNVGQTKLERLIAANPNAAQGVIDPEMYLAAMREGEEMLGQARFFDAESRFVRALAAGPGDPMARAGRVHAEIGAGLYLSAAANLRTLLTDAPEMAATRYADRLLPSGDRARTVVEQLLAEEKKAEGSALGREAALLVAYMGYQQGNQKLVAQGLQDFSARIAPDESGARDRALLELVTAAWSK